MLGFLCKRFWYFLSLVTVVTSKHGCIIVRVGNNVIVVLWYLFPIPLCVVLHAVHILGFDKLAHHQYIFVNCTLFLLVAFSFLT